MRARSVIFLPPANGTAPFPSAQYVPLPKNAARFQPSVLAFSFQQIPVINHPTNLYSYTNHKIRPV
ncbi:MAG: hypothetical protein JNL32_07960 [Candidatus Kapabacteria bacterium]|nr:hypothetical protein [Candidatus Kapabacteria bacterium]